jgi:hypothetical protein
MRIVTDADSEGLPLSALVLADICPCGEVALYTRAKDADFTSLNPCSDACKSIAETRESWLEVYGTSELFEDSYLNDSPWY